MLFSWVTSPQRATHSNIQLQFGKPCHSLVVSRSGELCKSSPRVRLAVLNAKPHRENRPSEEEALLQNRISDRREQPEPTSQPAAVAPANFLMCSHTVSGKEGKGKKEKPEEEFRAPSWRTFFIRAVVA